MLTSVVKGLAGAGVLYAGAKWLQPRLNTWGATPEEHAAHLPGEEALQSAQIAATHAITIEASASEIWPWIAQVGAGRGGFYSYAWLENLVGCQVVNADRILPQFQNLKAGDPVYLHPKAPPLRVSHLEKDRELALEGWIFWLKEAGPRRTRLISRTYRIVAPAGAGTGAKLTTWISNSLFFDVIHFIMGRKQLLELKRLVEGKTPLKQI